MRMKKLFCGLISVPLFFTIVIAQSDESFESVIKNGISRGVLKRNGNLITYIASPAQDTVSIRKYYEGLIKKSGKPYRFSIESNVATSPSKADDRNSPTVSSKKIIPSVSIADQHNERSIVPATATGTTGNPGAQGCWSRQIVFGELHFTDVVKEYNWTVPDGVSNIRIEAWSGGGNGYDSIYFTIRQAHEITQNLFAGVTGGGGGGGAYANAIIPVSRGDKVMIKIPGGGGGLGKSIQVKLNTDANAFYLNNGGNGNPNGLFGDGLAGGTGGTYGIFKNNLYWVGGEDGEVGHVSDFAQQDGKSGDGMLLPAGITTQQYTIMYGKGGNAALLNNGGRGAYLNRHRFTESPGSNGKFPGGGGGGGNNLNPETKPGKGAPGMVIIHY
jgi:hypothetical protein